MYAPCDAPVTGDRWAVIANLAAGRGYGRSQATHQATALNGQDAHATLRYTDAPGGAVRLAADALAASATRIVACGGDGTLHEVIIGIMAAPSHVRRGCAWASCPPGPATT